MSSEPEPCPDVAAAQAREAQALAIHAGRVAQLLRPGGIAPAVSGLPAGVAPLAPQRIETSLSTLLLFPERVLKLKKPLQRAFVDFSSLEARHEACLHELRLNRRTAPRHYLAVLPVRQAADGPVIAAPEAPVPGELVDWAVWMRRFDPRLGFDRLAAAGQLQPAQVDHLAEAVVHFHAQLPPAPPGYGRAEPTRHWPRDNLRELAGLLPPDAVQDRADLARLANWTEARGAELAPLIEWRRATGHVRECHGDLHLGNIVWADGAPLLFDALEFNDTLRHIDTVGDLAFTFMDLQAHGLPRLAWRFIGAALELSGDFGALPLLAWWAAYRAAVRAKVALLADPGAPGLARARHQLALALRLAGLNSAPTSLRSCPPGGRSGPWDGPAGLISAPTSLRSCPPRGRSVPWGGPAGLNSAPTSPRLVLMMGLSGSGKSGVAAVLAEALGGLRLRSDVERKRLHGLAPMARGGAGRGLYTPEATLRTRERLLDLADGALQAGVPVVVDAASLRRDWRDAFRALAARRRLPFTLLLCQAPEAQLRLRLAERQARDDDPSDAGPELLQQQLDSAEWPGEDEAAYTRRLETGADAAAWRRQIEAWAAEWSVGCRAAPPPSAA